MVNIVKYFRIRYKRGEGGEGLYFVSVISRELFHCCREAILGNHVVTEEVEDVMAAVTKNTVLTQIKVEVTPYIEVSNCVWIDDLDTINVLKLATCILRYTELIRVQNSSKWRFFAEV